jgi:hypothetical protein
MGWAQDEITPLQPVLLAGMFHARLSEGVHDPLTVTAWALQSGSEQAIFVSCDLISITEQLLDAVHELLDPAASGEPDHRFNAAGLEPTKVVLNATHTHTAPLADSRGHHARFTFGDELLRLNAMDVTEYVRFAAERIARTIVRAWNSRTPGGIAFGMGHAVIGRNRRWVDAAGRSTMYRPGAQDMQRQNAMRQTGLADVYGLDSSIGETFRHIEGYEDHTVQLIAAYDRESRLTGLVVNVPCPSQEGEEQFWISADWWHETRTELRRRFGENLFILPQCSAAGDLSPHVLCESAAQARMSALKGRTAREEIACRIADAVADVLPYIGTAIDWQPDLKHRLHTVELDANRLTEADTQLVESEMEHWQIKYEEERAKLEKQPELLRSPRWYVELTYAYSLMCRSRAVITRFERQQRTGKVPVNMHILRLGQLSIATQPFECYLDYGLQIKLRSPSLQTFLVQLAGKGSYLPSPRSLLGGGYGSTPASNPIGADGGQQLVEHTVQALRELWNNITPQSEVKRCR